MKIISEIPLYESPISTRNYQTHKNNKIHKNNKYTKIIPIIEHKLLHIGFSS